MQNKQTIELSHPTALDGHAVNRLVAASPPLDSNSTYCNLLQCMHFSDTCVCAKLDGAVVGFVSGYLIPSRPATLFIWQVAVAESARGQGLATRMLRELIASPACGNVKYLETTITGSNEASWILFRRLTASLGAELEVAIAFDSKTHFHGDHETEQLLRIGPLSTHIQKGE